MVAVAQRPRIEPEERLLLHGISWDQYSALLRTLGDQAGLRLTYLDGELELMSPSVDHELVKTLIARLLEAYADEVGLELEGAGSTTFRKKLVKRGIEPDECYMLGVRRGIPDLALEVVYSAPKIDKLEVYRGLGVGEVWIFKRNQIHVHVLGPKGYVARKKSALLPDLDLELFHTFLRPEAGQSAMVRAFRAALRERRR